MDKPTSTACRKVFRFSGKVGTLECWKLCISFSYWIWNYLPTNWHKAIRIRTVCVRLISNWGREVEGLKRLLNNLISHHKTRIFFAINESFDACGILYTLIVFLFKYLLYNFSGKRPHSLLLYVFVDIYLYVK